MMTSQFDHLYMPKCFELWPIVVIEQFFLIKCIYTYIKLYKYIVSI